MSDLTKKIDRALQYIDNFAPKTEPYYVCYSGGKDSDVILRLCNMWGGDYELHNNHTTADAPETVYYIRDVMKHFGERQKIYDEKDGHRIYKYGEKGFIHLPLKSMWRLIVDKGMPPTRIARFCCSRLKEGGGKGRVKMTGVRWAESVARRRDSGLVVVVGKSKTVQKFASRTGTDYEVNKKGGVILNTDNDEERRVVEFCYRTTNTLVNPIIDWTDEEVWEFIRQNNMEINPLYKCGMSRIGCLGCPMGGSKAQKAAFAMYPKYATLYQHAFDRMLLENEKKGRVNKFGFTNGEDVMTWWLGGDPNQRTMEQYMEDIGEDL